LPAATLHENEGPEIPDEARATFYAEVKLAVRSLLWNGKVLGLIRDHDLGRAGPVYLTPRTVRVSPQSRHRRSAL
jgi:hypothetical protein